MTHYQKETNLEPEEVMDLADDFFGQDGIGLVKVSHSEDKSCFEGESGRVEIKACKKNKTEVDLETRELDWQIKKFMRVL